MTCSAVKCRDIKALTNEVGSVVRGGCARASKGDYRPWIHIKRWVAPAAFICNKWKEMLGNGRFQSQRCMLEVSYNQK